MEQSAKSKGNGHEQLLYALSPKPYAMHDNT
jgi:hypothetical protein